MNVLPRVRARRRDREKWAQARTLQDVADLTALWLEGALGSQPGYARNHGPEDETESLIPTLARANRAGFLTTCSQPGGRSRQRNPHGVLLWHQRPAVEGFIHPGPLLDDLLAAAAHQGLLAVTATSDMRGVRDLRVPVTLDGGRPFTWFGGRYNPYLHDRLCPHAAAVDIDAAIQVALIDEHYADTRDLWDMLDSTCHSRTT